VWIGVVVARSADGQIGHAVVVEVSDPRHRFSETIVLVELPGESAFSGPDLDLPDRAPVRCEQEDPNGPFPAVATDMIRGCTQPATPHAVATQVAEDGHARAELIAHERPGERREDRVISMDGADRAWITARRDKAASVSARRAMSELALRVNQADDERCRHQPQKDATAVVAHRSRSLRDPSNGASS